MYMLGVLCKTGNNVSDAAIAKIDTMYRRAFCAKTKPVRVNSRREGRRGGFFCYTDPLKEIDTDVCSEY